VDGVAILALGASVELVGSLRAQQVGVALGPVEATVSGSRMSVSIGNSISVTGSSS